MSELFRIQNNIAAQFAQRQLNRSDSTLNEAQERLSSGYRINTASDDAAGLAISERLRMADRGLGQAERNAQDAISVLQTAEGGLETIGDNLQRMRELAVQAANDSLTWDDRRLIQTEVDQLVEEIDRSASSVQFNQRQLLKNDFGTVDASGETEEGSGSLVFHVGANRDEVMEITTDELRTMTSVNLGLRLTEDRNEIIEYPGGTLLYGPDDQYYALSLYRDSAGNLDRNAAESAIERITRAIDQVSDSRARIGAVQNRVESTIDFLQLQQENTQASESRIRDADLAEESVRRTQADILMQAGTSVLAQANQQPQLALQLLA